MPILENAITVLKLLRSLRSRATAIALNSSGDSNLNASGALSAARAGKWEALERAQFNAPESELEARAFWLNLYNTLTLHSLQALAVKGSVLDEPGFFVRGAYLVSGQQFTLNDIEHGVLRGNRAPTFSRIPFLPHDPRAKFALPLDARIHFALNCGAASCPAIRAFDAAHLESQLELSAASYLQSARLEAGTVWLPRLLMYYRQDFGDPLEFARRYRPDLPQRAQVRFDPYSWAAVRP